MKKFRKGKLRMTWPLGRVIAPIETEHISTDPMGSYTGRPADPLDKPIQDADDL